MHMTRASISPIQLIVFRPSMATIPTEFAAQNDIFLFYKLLLSTLIGIMPDT